MTTKSIKKICMLICCMAVAVCFAKLINDYLQYIEIKNTWSTNKIDFRKLQNEVSEIRKSLELYDREKLAFEELLFKEKDVPAFLDGISAFAQQSLVNVVDMKTKKFKRVEVPSNASNPNAKKRKKQNVSQEARERLKKAITLAAMPINIKVIGTYPDFIKFIGYLEEFEQLMTISNVEIASGKEYPLLKCGFTLKIYSLKTLEELGY